jgi:hypothetical protein
MKTIIINNFLSIDLNNYLNNYLKDNVKLVSQTSNNLENKKPFLMGIFNYCPLMDFIFNKIQNKIKKKLTLTRCYSNLQYPDMDGSFHTDDGDITCLYMIHGNGPFEIKNDKKIKFKEGRLIIFDAKKLHKGHAPKKGYRITLAFKAKIKI